MTAARPPGLRPPRLRPAALRPAAPPSGLALLRAVAQRVPLDLQARARRNAWAGMSEVRATARARREAEDALAALDAAPALDVTVDGAQDHRLHRLAR